MTDETRKIAVLTGDIVGSTALGPEKLERAFDALKDCAETQAEWMGESLHFTRHRGDGWQVALAEPKYALRSALMFRAALRSLGAEFDSYIGIAVGPISTDLAPNLNSENAEVFVSSGRALEIAKRQGTYFLHDSGGMVDALTLSMELMSHGWTKAQSQAAMYSLPPHSDLSFTEISDILEKSRQTVTKALNSIAIEQIRMILTQFESDKSHV
ncbi:hypothetical protein [Pacificibacter marinus]|uniref:hypothetical protein n=1 Tax=Pacificibacter marinus TaxID=658057 RepID=UPI001C07395F|nr:hypothetical protein [Pacificibacter marinus]MBU2867938.1 hypothetical protein [Pacificibacter marinus]